MDKKEQLNITRLAAVQLMYQIQDTDIDVLQALADYSVYFSKMDDEDNVLGCKIDFSFLEYLVKGCDERQKDVVQIISKTSKYSMDRLEKILQAILKIAVFELLEPQDNISVGEIISSYLDITDSFYDKKEIGIVNAILDQVAKTIS